MESNEKLDLDTSKVESKDKWQMFDILNVKHPTVAKLKESLTLAKTTCANLEALYINEQLNNEKLLEQMAKVNNDNMRKTYTIERLDTANKAHEETIDNLEGQLAAKKAVKSYPFIAVIIIAVIEALIIFCLV